MDAATAYCFGNHRLEPARHQLLADGRPLKLGGRAFDLLLALVERQGRTVSKDELLELVWPQLVVEENNLQVQVAALRKLLGNAAIATVPGRGYRFTPEVSVQGPCLPAAGPAGTLAPAAATPSSAAPALLGRAHDLAELLTRLRSAPLVTLSGSGGIGKSRLAEAALASWPSGGTWVALAPLSAPQDVAQAVARALGATTNERAAEAVVSVLAARPQLLVLDNAEHVLPGVLALAQTLLQRLPQAHVLVTSQEALRLPQEQLLRLAPLALPSAPGLAAAQASAAVALFMARAQAADRRLVLREDNADAVADICRRLDGLPLAIELAAARAPLLGVHGLLARLDDQLRLLSSGPHGADPRQQTLRAALAWSHGLLDGPAQRVLRRLAVFSGGFTMEAAQHAGCDEALDEWAVLDQLGTLVDKSLVLVDRAEPPRYRLLESTRLYALEQLAAQGETDAACRRQAEATVAVLQGLRQAHPRPTGVLLAGLIAEVDNARVALQWAAKSCEPARASGDDPLWGVRLATEVSYAFAAANLNAEYLQQVQPWIEHVAAQPCDPTVAFALLRRVAAAGRNASHALALRAALLALPLARAGAGTPLELFNLLVTLVAVGARRGTDLPYETLLDEARALQTPDMPLPVEANWHWARERWLQRAGRTAEAVGSALAQVEVLRAYADVGAPQITLLNAANFELALGRVAEAEAHAREALEALSGAHSPPSAFGYGHGLLAACLARRGDWREALRLCDQARPALEIEGDEDLLLPVLAECAEGQGRPWLAACIVGHLDAQRQRSGWLPNPDEAAERARLIGQLDQQLSVDDLAAALRRGAEIGHAELMRMAAA